MNEKQDKAEASLKSAAKTDNIRISITIQSVSRDKASEIIQSVTDIIGVQSYSVYIDEPLDDEDD